ncbi:MAG: hypothetical protein E6J08_15080, partial [Chloroflexi bacterium]
ELKFLDYEFGQPKFSVEECRNRDMTYAAPLRIRTRLTIKETGEIKESEVYMGDFAMMTDQGTFIVNGTERVVVSQLVRSPGVYFTAAEDPNTGRKLFGAKLIPNRGAWLEIETSAKDLLTVARPDGDVCGRRQQPRPPLHGVDARQGHDDEDRGRAPRAVPPRPPRRPTERGQRAQPAAVPFLQPAPVRPRPRRPLQGRQAIGPR